MALSRAAPLTVLGSKAACAGISAGADDAGDDGDQHEVPEGDGAGEGERGEGEGGERRADAAEHYDAGAVVAVGQCAAERGEHPGPIAAKVTAPLADALPVRS